MLRLLLREETADRGVVTVDGRNLGKLPNRKVPDLRRKIGCVFQDFRLLPKKTVYENVAFALEVINKSQQAIKRTVPEVLDLVGLDGKANAAPHELSGGEQQRVAIARAFVNRPARAAGRRADGKPRPRHQPGHHGPARTHQPHRHHRR